MADMELERRPRRGRGGNWVWWIVGALVIVLLIWWWVGDWGGDNDNGYAANDETADQVAPAPVTSPAPVTTTSAIPIADIVSNPQTYVGQSYSGDVLVTESPTPRGFWAQDDASGQRIFVVVTEEPSGQPLSVTTDQRYTLRDATVSDASTLGSMGGEPLDQQTQDIAQQQPVVLTVSAMNVQPSTGTAGTQNGTGMNAPPNGGGTPGGVNQPADVGGGNNDEGGR